MARTVTYSVVPRIDPRQKNDPPKYYAQAQARGDVSVREMAERIQASCTVHKTDVYAVLVALEDVGRKPFRMAKSSDSVNFVPFRYPSVAKVPSPRKNIATHLSRKPKLTSDRERYWLVRWKP